MSGGTHGPPKVLIRFGGKTLLQRHLEALQACGIREVVMAVGYRAHLIAGELAHLDAAASVRTVFNEDYEQGSIVSLWRLCPELTRGGDLLLMDADVLYDSRLLQRLLASPHANCFLLDRDYEPGDEPVKLCVHQGRLVEFRKHLAGDLQYDLCGESIGFFRLSEAAARRLADTVDGYIRQSLREAPYEEALRDLLLESADGFFGYEDITGLPWVEIDFPQDVHRAAQEIEPRLMS